MNAINVVGAGDAVASSSKIFLEKIFGIFFFFLKNTSKIFLENFGKIRLDLGKIWANLNEIRATASLYFKVYIT